MRRALRPQWPAFAERFGLMPWHLDGGPPILTFGEQDALVEWLAAEAHQREIDEWKRTLPGG